MHGQHNPDLTINLGENGFDTLLCALATKILDEEAPDLDRFPGRDWHRSGLHTALQTFAHVRGLSGTGDLIALERFARDVAQRQARERPF